MVSTICFYYLYLFVSNYLLYGMKTLRLCVTVKLVICVRINS